jgi:DNA polymerase-1
MSDYGLAQATGMTRDEAANFISRYFERYPDVRKFLDRTKTEARKLGYVKTLLGRKRFLSDVNSENRIVRESAERMAINAPVQGTSADIIKVAMLEIYKWMHQETMTSKMLLQIHDELLFEVPEKELESMMRTVTTLMSKAIQLSVPLKITVKVGRNWGEMTAY